MKEITAKDAIANDKKVEWIAVSVMRKMGYDGFIKQHISYSDQMKGDFSMEEEKVLIEIKHRASKTYDEWIREGRLEMAIPYKWITAPEGTTFIHINSFPEIGEILVFEIEKGDWEWVEGWNGKNCWQSIGKKEKASFQLKYAEENLRIWKWRQGKSLY